MAIPHISNPCVHFFQGELTRMSMFVKDNPNLVTFGSLYGLRTHSGSPVVHLTTLQTESNGFIIFPSDVYPPSEEYQLDLVGNWFCDQNMVNFQRLDAIRRALNKLNENETKFIFVINPGRIEDSTLYFLVKTSQLICTANFKILNRESAYRFEVVLMDSVTKPRPYQNGKSETEPRENCSETDKYILANNNGVRKHKLGIYSVEMQKLATSASSEVETEVNDNSHPGEDKEEVFRALLIDVYTNAQSDPDSQLDAMSQSDTNSHTNLDRYNDYSPVDCETTTDADTNPDAGTNPDADANPDADTNPDADANPDADTNPDADANPDADTNADANPDADANPNADANPDTKSDADTKPDPDTNSDADQHSDPESVKNVPVKTGEDNPAIETRLDNHTEIGPDTESSDNIEAEKLQRPPERTGKEIPNNIQDIEKKILNQIKKQMNPGQKKLGSSTLDVVVYKCWSLTAARNENFDFGMATATLSSYDGSKESCVCDDSFDAIAAFAATYILSKR